MHDVGYVRVADDAEALAVLAARPDASVIAGGTELVNLLKERIAAPSLLVDINDLDLGEIRADPAGLRLGTLARMSDVAADPAVRQGYPALVEALELSASPQVRNMATVGGNLMQRTRCPYFRADTPLPCNKRTPGTGCAVTDGYGRDSAVFGWSETCRATQPSDLAVALAALDARIRLRSPRGERTVAVTDFHRLPGDEPERDTVLAPDELITAVEVPVSAGSTRSCYLKVRERSSYEFALVSVAVAVETDGAVITAARIALGGVAAKPWRLYPAESALAGTPLTVTDLRAAIEPAFADARPHRDNTFKVELARRAVVRALLSTGGLA